MTKCKVVIVSSFLDKWRLLDNIFLLRLNWCLSFLCLLLFLRALLTLIFLLFLLLFVPLLFVLLFILFFLVLLFVLVALGLNRLDGFIILF